MSGVARDLPFDCDRYLELEGEIGEGLLDWMGLGCSFNG